MNAGVSFGNKVKETIQILSFFIGDARDIGNIRTVCFLEGWNLRVGCMYSVNLFAGIRVHFHIFVEFCVIGTDQLSQRFGLDQFIHNAFSSVCLHNIIGNSSWNTHDKRLFGKRFFMFNPVNVGIAIVEFNDGLIVDTIALAARPSADDLAAVNADLAAGRLDFHDLRKPRHIEHFHYFGVCIDHTERLFSHLFFRLRSPRSPALDM